MLKVLCLFIIYQIPVATKDKLNYQNLIILLPNDKLKDNIGCINCNCQVAIILYIKQKQMMYKT